MFVWVNLQAKYRHEERQIQQMFSVEEGESSVNSHYKTHFDLIFVLTYKLSTEWARRQIDEMVLGRK